MRNNLKTLAIASFAAILGASLVALAAQTNYLGTVFIADTTTPANQLKVNSNGSINTSSVAPSSGATYNTVAASQTTQALTGGSGGAVGDYLSFCLVIPTSTSPGVVTIIDNATTVVAFPGGSSSISNLVPFALPVGSVSVSGAWKVTTGANLSAVCVGKFT